MNYPEFLAGAKKLAGQPSPIVWQHIEQSLWPQNVLAFPRLRLMLLAAAFALVCVFPTTILVANHDRQEMYAYLQNTGSSEYVTLASTNY